MDTLIAPENTWLLLALTCGVVAGAIWLEQDLCLGLSDLRSCTGSYRGHCVGQPERDSQPCAHL